MLELLGVDRSHRVVWNWTYNLAETQDDPPTAAVEGFDGEEKWLYAAADTESKILLEIDVDSRRGTGPAAAFLYGLTEKHDVSETEFLADSGYLIALFRHELSGQLNYSERNHMKK